jgi:uncharacterized UBP type Zn finger protein
MAEYPCDELAQSAARAQPVIPQTHGCEECLAVGSNWVHLRLCMSCGHVGCCDSSPNKHATKHFKQAAHPVIRSYEPGEAWAYCYPHEEWGDELPGSAIESAPVHYTP